MQTWFTSDLHADHKNIISYTNRPWNNVTEMIDGLINNWNSVVAPGDLVYNLGDFCFGRAQTVADICARLNGTIRLIRGNHDANWLKDMAKKNIVIPNLEWVKDYYMAKIQDGKEAQRIVLFHYPIAIWDGRHHGAFHLHGHSHSGFPQSSTSKYADVGVDTCWLPTHKPHTPYSYNEVKELMSTKVFKSLDHHNEDTD